MYTFCNKVLSPRRQIPNRLSVFNCRYSVFFGIVNTDVGVGIGISKYRIAVRYFGQRYRTYRICPLQRRFTFWHPPIRRPIKTS